MPEPHQSAGFPDQGLSSLIVEAAPNAMLMIDDRSSIVMVNRGTERLFRRDRDEMIGEDVELLVPLRFRDHHRGYVRSFFQSARARPMGAGRDLYGLRSDGTEVPIEIGLNPLQTPDGLFVLASIIDITERRRATEQFRLVVEAAPDAILVINRSREIRLVNRRAEELFGYKRQDLVGSLVETLVPARFKPGHAEKVESFFEAPQARSMGSGRDLFGQRRDGTEVPIEIGLNPLEIDGALHTLVSIIDITERRRQETELRRSNAELEQFAYIASHDLQEPLRTVANYATLLSQRYGGQLDERADKYINYAVDGAKRMQNLVTDLLAYSRVGSQGGELRPTEVDEVLKSVLHSLRAQIRETRATIEAGPLPRVLADPIQLGQVLQNLIGNAIKFRSEATPAIEIRWRRLDDHVLFEIEDNGIGLDTRFADRAFQMFQRLHERGTYPGSGIGLSITKKIIERHGGEIWLESQVGAGTTVSFTLLPAPEKDPS